MHTVKGVCHTMAAKAARLAVRIGIAVGSPIDVPEAGQQVVVWEVAVWDGHYLS